MQKISLLLALAFLATACGTTVRDAEIKKQNDPKTESTRKTEIPAGLDKESSDASIFNNNNYRCPATANIVPAEGRNLSALPDAQYMDPEAGNYIVCEHLEDHRRLLVHGVTYSPDTHVICLYLAKRTIDGGLEPSLSSRGVPIKTCGDILETNYEKGIDGGVYLSLPIESDNSDSAMIVEARDELAMDQCIAQGHPELCPIYSKGTFREILKR